MAPTHPDARLDLVRVALREQGLDDGGASPHSWRCEHPDRYPGYCTCVDDVARAVLAAVDAGGPTGPGEAVESPGAVGPAPTVEP